MNDPRPIVAIFDLAGLELANRFTDIDGHRPRLGIGHQPTGAEHLAQLSYLRHELRGRNREVKVETAAILDFFDQFFTTHDIGARLLGLASLLPGGKNCYPKVFAGAVWQGDRPSNPLISMLGVNSEAEISLNALVELGEGIGLYQLKSFPRLIAGARFSRGCRSGVFLPVLSHYLLPVVQAAVRPPTF